MRNYLFLAIAILGMSSAHALSCSDIIERGSQQDFTFTIGSEAISSITWVYYDGKYYALVSFTTQGMFDDPYVYGGWDTRREYEEVKNETTALETWGEYFHRVLKHYKVRCH